MALTRPLKGWPKGNTPRAIRKEYPSPPSSPGVIRMGEDTPRATRVIPLRAARTA